MPDSKRPRTHTDIVSRDLNLLHFPGILAVDISSAGISVGIVGYQDNGDIAIEVQDTYPIPIYDHNMQRQYPEFEHYFQTKFLEQLLAIIDKARQKPNCAKLPIGISFAGQVSQKGEIFSASTIFHGALHRPINLLHLIRQHFKLRSSEVFIINDIGAAAWRYSIDPDLQNLSRFMVLYAGWGLGSKIFDTSEVRLDKNRVEIRKEVLIDHNGRAGELGHVRVRRPSFLEHPVNCDCGNTDHLASFILPHGILELLTHFKNAYNVENPQQAISFPEITEENVIQLIGKLFDQENLQLIGKKVIRTIAEMFNSVIIGLILGIGVDKVVVTGEVFSRWGKKATNYFIETLVNLVRRDLVGYFDIKDDFVVEKTHHIAAESALSRPYLTERQACLEGMLIYIDNYYRTHYCVTNGFFDKYEAYRLTSCRDIEYPVIWNDTLFDPEDDLLTTLTYQKKVLVIVDEYYDNLTNFNVSDNISRYFRSKSRVVSNRIKNKPSSFREEDVIIEAVNPVLNSASGNAENKTLEGVLSVIEWAYKYQLPRDGILVAVGGGVVLDTVGFAAQQFRRMIDYIRIPTTLIGQIDAGIGIKVGVNYKDAKNLVGSFYPPLAVINDMNFLYDLDEDQVNCGITEILKMGIIVSNDIITVLTAIANFNTQLYGKTIKGNTYIQKHMKLVMNLAVETMLTELQYNLDEKDLRRKVDFGHTFSPIIESELQYCIHHGYAVAIDIFISVWIAANTLGLTGDTLIPERIAKKYIALLRKLKLLPEKDFLQFISNNREQIFEKAIAKSIDHRGGNLNLVVPVRRMGDAGFINLTECLTLDDEIYAAIVTREHLRSCFEIAVSELCETNKGS